MRWKSIWKTLIFATLLILFAPLSASSLAHSGGTDSQGGHNGPDGYHYHHGYPAHQHPNGECPYDFDDNVDHRDRSGDGSSTGIRTSSSGSIAWYWLALIFIAIFFVSFYIPSIVAVWLKKDVRSVGCISWIVFITLLIAFAYLHL